MVSLNNHIQSMFAGCINVFPLLTCKEYKFQYSVREFYQDSLRNKKKLQHFDFEQLMKT